MARIFNSELWNDLLLIGGVIYVAIVAGFLSVFVTLLLYRSALIESLQKKGVNTKPLSLSEMAIFGTLARGKTAPIWVLPVGSLIVLAAGELANIPLLVILSLGLLAGSVFHYYHVLVFQILRSEEKRDIARALTIRDRVDRLRK